MSNKIKSLAQDAMPFFILLAIVAIGILSSTEMARAAIQENETNQTASSTVNIANNAPRFVDDSLDVDDDDLAPDAEIDITPGDNKTVWCNGTINDMNGDTDITGVNGTFFNDLDTGAFPEGASPIADENKSRLYHDTDCDYDSSSGNGTSGTYTCGFNVTFWANASNEWNCTIIAVDGSAAETQNSTLVTLTLSSALAINDTAVDFGSLGLGADTGTTDYSVNVTNVGNVNLTLQIDAYRSGQSDPRADTEGMACTAGTIAATQVRYDTGAQGTAWGSKTQVTGNGINTEAVGLKPNTNESWIDNDRVNPIHFGVGVPVSGVSGTCTGVILIHGIAGST